MQHSVLQLYHKYKAMAINFLRIKPLSDILYQNRTHDVPLTNRIVYNSSLTDCNSMRFDSGTTLLIVRTVDLISCDCFGDRSGWKTGPFLKENIKD